MKTKKIKVQPKSVPIQYHQGWKQINQDKQAEAQLALVTEQITYVFRSVLAAK